MTAQAKTLDTAGLAERARVLAALRQEDPKLRGLGITRLSLFGSMARGEIGPASDVDLLMELDPESRFDLFELVDLQDDLRASRPIRAFHLRLEAAALAARGDPQGGDRDLLMKRRGLCGMVAGDGLSGRNRAVTTRIS